MSEQEPLRVADEVPRVYGPSDWRELTGAPLPSLPGKSIPCAAVKSDGRVCGNFAVAGTPLCRAHGGTTLSVQEQARRRIDAVRSQLFQELCSAAKDAVQVYVTIMNTGKRDADRLRAADRVLEMLGMRDDIAHDPRQDGESEIDKQLKALLSSVTDERLSRAIDTTVTEGNDKHDP